MIQKIDKNLIKKYLNDCNARLTKNTVKNHRVCLNAFYNFLNGKSITDTTLNDVREFLNKIVKDGRSKSTLIGKFYILCSFYRYIETYHGIMTPCMKDICIDDYAKHACNALEREPLTKSEIRALIEAPDNLRDTLIIAILYYAGLRVNEAATLKIENVDTENRILIVTGKGNKTRSVPYSSKLDRVINLWLKKERRSYVSSNSPFFFPSKHNEHLSPKTISNMVHNYAIKAGIQKVIGKKADGSKIYRVHPHILRHSYASHAADDEIPITLIQKMMGHSHISTTIGYMGETNGYKSYYDKFKGI
jgi:site-specific recombinase XerD